MSEPNLRPGPDHDLYDWSPIPNRRGGSWPGGPPLACCIIVALDTLTPPGPGGLHRPQPLGSLGVRPFPDLARISQHEYGNRVGVFRLVDELEHRAIPFAVSIDAASVMRNPWLAKWSADHAGEIVCGGWSAAEPLTSERAPGDERSLIERARHLVADGCERPVEGWLGPSGAESSATLRLLSDAGFSYVGDWACDDQPFPFTLGEGRHLWAIPRQLELDAVHALVDRGLTARRWADAVEAGADRLARDGRRTRRVLVLVLHAWVIGQPHRRAALRRALDALVSLDPWWATPREVLAVATGGV